MIPSRIDSGVDPDEMAGDIHQRPSRVTRVYRGIGLDEVIVVLGANAVTVRCANESAATPSSFQRYSAQESTSARFARPARRDFPSKTATSMKISCSCLAERNAPAAFSRLKPAPYYWACSR
jgi:hypothetical protein